MDRGIVLMMVAALSLWLVPCAVGSGDSGSASEGQQMVMTDTVAQYGITWKFGEKVPVGRFVNGDYYVVGPVTVVSIDPKPTPGRNGSVLNLPPLQDRSGFDDRVEGGRFHPEMRSDPPIHMEPGDALISSISVKEIGVLPAPMRPADKAISPVYSVSILTCLAQAVPADAFRPSYCDRKQDKIHLTRDLRRDLLPSLPRVKDTPELKEWEDRYQRPWLDVCFFGFDAPIAYMPHYARELGRAAGISTLLLMLGFPKEQKEKLLVEVVQRGIDLWGIVEAGYPGWQAHGGHGSGRKWPIVFAGIMLGDRDMESPYRKYPDVKFGEDMQTIYGKGWTGDTALYGGHMGPDGEKVGGPGWGAYEHLQPREWKNMMNESYRRCCTSIAWVGEALAIRLMHAQKTWDHDAFFDYVDRWMTEDDTEATKIIKEQTGADFSADYARQGQAWDPFVNEMWAKYRCLPAAGEAAKQTAQAADPSGCGCSGP
jgi:hypothetical protein